MQNKSAPKISRPTLAALRSELAVKNGHAQLTVLASPAIMEKIVRGLRSFELVARGPREVLVRCLYTIGLPAYEFQCVTSDVGATFGAHLSTLSIWRKDLTGRVKKLCERPALLFVPSPAAATNDATPTPPPRPGAAPIHHRNDRAEVGGMLFLANEGPAIKASNYWDSPMARAGKFCVSLNASCLRVLVPDNRQHLLADMLRGVSWIEVKALPLAGWTEDRVCTQWTFEDFTPSPGLFAFSPGAFLDAFPKQGESFTIAFWTRREGEPHRHAELPGHWVTVPVLPMFGLAR